MQAEIQEYELGSHGMVGFTPEGKPKVTIPGHKFGEVDLVAKVEELLAP